MLMHGREPAHAAGTVMLNLEAVSAYYNGGRAADHRASGAHATGHSATGQGANAAPVTGVRATGVRTTGVRTTGVRATRVRANGYCALENISLHLAAGERLAVVGPNGAGKSTLFKVITGIHRPAAGTVQVYGSAPNRHVCIAYIEQNPSLNWDFPVTVEDVVAMGRIARVGYFRFAGRRDRALVTEALERVAIADLRRRQIGELSGGQQRRMFIARALAQEAEIMLLDEPFAGLDADAHAQLAETLDALSDRIALMVATHDLGVAERLGQVLLLNRRVIASGPAAEVLVADHLAAAYGNNVRRLDADGTGYLLPDSHCDHGEEVAGHSHATGAAHGAGHVDSAAHGHGVGRAQSASRGHAGSGIHATTRNYTGGHGHAEGRGHAADGAHAATGAYSAGSIHSGGASRDGGTVHPVDHVHSAHDRHAGDPHAGGVRRTASRRRENMP